MVLSPGGKKRLLASLVALGLVVPGISLALNSSLFDSPFGPTSTAASSSADITVFAHRIPASYWDPCFATSCTNPYAPCDAGCTGPGAAMYFALYDSAGNFVTGGFADEHGFRFTGLAPGSIYYVYPDDCDSCHGSTHDVVFQHWGDGRTSKPIPVTIGQSLEAWYSCTNGCGGG